MCTVLSIAAAVLCDSAGFSPPQTAAATQSSMFRGIDRTALLESLRNELSASELEHLYSFDPVADLLLSETLLDQNGRRGDLQFTARLDQTGHGRRDLPAVAEERSEDERCGTVDSEVRCSRKRDGLAGRVYSCDHCHCSVCKRSLEMHECQRSISSSSEHEMMTDDAGGTAVYSASLLFPYDNHTVGYIDMCSAQILAVG